MNITIRDIAAQAGVTKSTVSKVLNNRPGVGEATRRKVMEVVERTGFRPSSAARALARGDTENIALLIPREAGLSLNGAYWSSLITSIAMEAADRGRNLLLLTPGEDSGEMELVEEMVSHRKADGLIIGLPRLASGVLAFLEERNFPFVTVGRYAGWESRAVDADNAGGAAAMADYMIERGYSRIAMLTGPESLVHMRSRAGGFRAALEKRGRHPAGIRYSEFDRESVAANLKALLSDSEPDALFVGSGGDFLLQVLRGLAGLGIDRHQLGLAVFDDYPYLDFTDPGITAVRQPTEELGRRAVAFLEEDQDGPAVLPTVIVPRRSCGEQGNSVQ